MIRILLVFLFIVSSCYGQEYKIIPQSPYSTNVSSAVYRDVMSSIVRGDNNGRCTPEEYRKYGEFPHPEIIALHETVHCINANHSMMNDYQFLYIEKGKGLVISFPKVSTRQVMNKLPSQLKKDMRYDTYVVEMQDRDGNNLVEEWCAYMQHAHFAIELYESGQDYGLNELEGMVDLLTFSLYVCVLDSEWTKQNKKQLKVMLDRSEMIYKRAKDNKRLLGHSKETLEFINTQKELVDIVKTIKK